MATLLGTITTQNSWNVLSVKCFLSLHGLSINVLLINNVTYCKINKMKYIKQTSDFHLYYQTQSYLKHITMRVLFWLLCYLHIMFCTNRTSDAVKLYNIWKCRQMHTKLSNTGDSLIPIVTESKRSENEIKAECPAYLVIFKLHWSLLRNT